MTLQPASWEKKQTALYNKTRSKKIRHDLIQQPKGCGWNLNI